MTGKDATTINIIKSIKSDVLTIEEVADFMRIPLSTARKLAPKKDVDFPKSFKVGRHRRWTLDTVDKYMSGDEDARA